MIKLLIGCLINCVNTRSSNEHSVHGTAVNVMTKGMHDRTEKVLINTKTSKVEWKGTKLMGAGSHSGTVNFKNGYLLFSEGKLIGGEFTVDMSSIFITDIPLSDPVPRKNITTHLNIDFETKVFHVSTFKIITVSGKPDGYSIDGALTIKGITRPISIKAREVKRKAAYTSEFSFDRFNWKIGEHGSWLEKKLVDADISLKININVR